MIAEMREALQPHLAAILRRDVELSEPVLLAGGILTVQPFCQLPADAATATVTCRDTASVRAYWRSPARSLLMPERFVETSTRLKLGTAIMARMAATARVTISSTSVKPQARQPARKRFVKSIGMIWIFPGTTVCPCRKPTMRTGSSSLPALLPSVWRRAACLGR